jgi:hypothetical protein
MASVTAKIAINLPLSQAWELLSDLRLAHHYVPGIIDTRITTPTAKGVGASRTVVRSNGDELQETVTDWWEGKGFQLRLHKGAKDAPLRNAFFRYQLRELSPRQSELSATLGYDLPFGMVGRLVDRTLLKRIIRPMIDDVVIGLKNYYEQGQKPDAKQRKLLRAALR